MYEAQKTTLCWDCANATGLCDWSSELKPIKGWTVKIIPKELTDKGYDSVKVIECPEFDRDSTRNGMYRIRRVKR